MIPNEDTIASRNPGADLDASSYLNASMSSQNPIYRTAEKPHSKVIFNEDPVLNNSSFRVENRRARPKIVKNVNNICNIFIFQNNNSSLTHSNQPT
jgi:hypothetical protein